MFRSKWNIFGHRWYRHQVSFLLSYPTKCAKRQTFLSSQSLPLQAVDGAEGVQRSHSCSNRHSFRQKRTVVSIHQHGSYTETLRYRISKVLMRLQIALTFVSICLIKYCRLKMIPKFNKNKSSLTIYVIFEIYFIRCDLKVLKATNQMILMGIE